VKVDLTNMGFGITSSVDHHVVRELAPRLEEAGFRTLWINHGGTGDSLASIQVAASVTGRIRLASGVIPVDRVVPEEVVRSAQERALPLDRLVIGIGASAPPSPLQTIANAASFIHERLGVPVMVGALGPRMRRLGVRETDGVLLNWLTPEAARRALAEKSSDLADLTDKQAEVALYIRTALGQDGRPVLEREAARYEAIPSYAANFARLGFRALESAVYGETPQEIREGLERFLGTVDEPVVRAITANDALEEFLALVDTVA
jgi:alkanesulfonate monooxygenase SsuD/methylene tetrahydromethanopterin reductase-like flavin-dependent oxidoreductase (luciferase family)